MTCPPSLHLAPVVAGLLAAGCAEPIDSEQRALGEVTRDCVVTPRAPVVALGEPWSLATDGGALLVFDEVELEDGGRVANAAAFVETGRDLCAERLELLSDPSGAPLSLLEPGDQERMDDEARGDGRSTTLVLRGSAGESPFVYHEVGLAGPGLFDYQRRGVGVCRLDLAGDAPSCVREMPPSLERLDSRRWRGSALVADDEVYLYSCNHAAAFVDLCGVSRAPTSKVTMPAAYRHYNDLQGWIDDPGDRTVLFEAAGEVTVSQNQFLGLTVAAVANIWDSTIEIRTAPGATGPFTTGDLLFAMLPPVEQWFIAGGKQQVPLQTDDQQLVFTYGTDARGAEGLHLVEFRLADDAGWLLEVGR